MGYCNELSLHSSSETNNNYKNNHGSKSVGNSKRVAYLMSESLAVFLLCTQIMLCISLGTKC